MTHGIEVADEVALGGAGLGEEWRVEVGEGERVGHQALILRVVTVVCHPCAGGE
jgi:hypothetical protein